MKKKQFLKWKEINSDLQSFFLIRLLGLSLIFIAEVVIDISTKNRDVAIFLLAITVFYILWEGFFFFMAIQDKILVFEGVCEKKRISKREISNPIIKSKQPYELYGKSSLTMSISITDETGQNNVAKFLVPIPANTEIEEQNTVRVYCLESSVFKRNDNSFEITNPLIVKSIRF